MKMKEEFDLIEKLSVMLEDYVESHEPSLLIDFVNNFKKENEELCTCKRDQGHSAGTLLDGTDLIICNRCGKKVVYGSNT